MSDEHKMKSHSSFSPDCSLPRVPQTDMSEPPPKSDSSPESSKSSYSSSSPSFLAFLLVSISFSILSSPHLTDACSTRSAPRPRMTTLPAARPHILFQKTYECPAAYSKWFCLNFGACFAVRIGDSILYNCECETGYTGDRCQFKDLDGTYAFHRRITVAQAGLCSGFVVFVVLASFLVILFIRRRRRLEEEEKRPACPELGSVIVGGIASNCR